MTFNLKINVNMRKIASLFTMLMLFSALAFGQNRTITGTVTDDTGNPLPGVTVVIKGTRTGTSADNNGQFRIFAKTGEVLVVSGAGLEPTEATVGAGSTVTIAVKRTFVTGTEVVVTALSQTRQAKELGFSTAKVKASELTQAKPVNLQQGLTGKVSGLNVQTVNNGVFSDTRITLRGIRSLTGNNQPMLILDGSPIGLGYISSLNPNDILSVTILKGANATAIYGPDGVNGALVIQTKRGSRYSSNSYFWSSYRLKDREDVDYLQEIKESLKADLPKTYADLKKTFGFDASFYFDIAQHFYSRGLKKEAMNILFSAADISSGNRQVQLAIGYILEAWKELDEAINVYKELLQSDGTDMVGWRNLALAYYQKGSYQQSVNAY